MKENILLVILIIVFGTSIINIFVVPNLPTSEGSNQETADVVYTDEYKESMRQNVIKELYGSREAYATEKTGDRSDYVDKAASKSGELVIDEVKMQQVYDSKLKEFDSKIDNDKVDAIVNERLSQMVDAGTYNGVTKSQEVTSKKVMYWENGGKYFALIVEAFMILYILYRKIKRHN